MAKSAPEAHSTQRNIVNVNVNVAASDEDDDHRAPNDGHIGGSNSAFSDELSKAPRLPRWTRQEILVLIQGKRVAEGRVRRGRAGAGVVEPKWASVSAYCRRHGVNRGPVQCRKRWSNLFGDFKKIKEWEMQGKDEADSFWSMRNDLRREKRLPGFFDREVYTILDGAVPPPAILPPPADETIRIGNESIAVNKMQEDGDEDGVHEAPTVASSARNPNSKGISEKGDDGGEESAKRKRKVTSDVEDDGANWQRKMTEVLDRNGKLLAAHLEAQNANCRLEREQRKEIAASLVSVLGKLADAIAKVADKL